MNMIGLSNLIALVLWIHGSAVSKLPQISDGVLVAHYQGLAACARNNDDENHGESLKSVTTTRADDARVFVLIRNNFAETISVQIANDLRLPVVSEQELSSLMEETSRLPPLALVVEPYEYGSDVQDYAIALQSLKIDGRKRGKKAVVSSTCKPLFVDFSPYTTSRLSTRGTAGGDLLVKAVSPRNARIWDLTAGLGQDSVVLALAGAQHVTMVERDPIVATLLGDALRRLDVLAEFGDEATRKEASSLRKKLSLHVGDGVEIVKTMNGLPPDIVYLDPMFPARKKSAAVKKNMQLLHTLLDSQMDQDESMRLGREQSLIQAALVVAEGKVIIKRPIHAPPLGCSADESRNDNDRASTYLCKPSYEIRGSINRWDIYVVKSA